MTAPDTCPIRGTPLSQQSRPPNLPAHLHLHTPLQPESRQARSHEQGSAKELPTPGWGQGPPPQSCRLAFSGEALPVPESPATNPGPDPQIRFQSDQCSPSSALLKPARPGRTRVLSLAFESPRQLSDDPSGIAVAIGGEHPLPELCYPKWAALNRRTGIAPVSQRGALD